VNETVLFKPLSLEEIEQIVDLLIADVNQRLADKAVKVVLETKARSGWPRRVTTRSLRPAAQAFPAAPPRDAARPRPHRRGGHRGLTVTFKGRATSWCWAIDGRVVRFLARRARALVRFALEISVFNAAARARREARIFPLGP